MPSPPLSIVQSISPRIAVLTSDDVVDSCEANGCKGLDELLRPWEGGTERVSILSSTLTPTIHPTFPLRFVPYATVFPAPEQATPNVDVIVDLISSFVAARKPDEEQHYPLTRSLLLASRPIASHETFNHPVGLLLAVSTSELEPMESLRRLVGRATGPMSQVTPWMDGLTVMRFYIVVHDVSRAGGDLAKAHELLGQVKKMYGPHSTLLVINSQIDARSPPTSPDITTHPSIPLPRPFTPVDMNTSALSQVYASALSSLTLSPSAAFEQISEDGPLSPTKSVRRKRYGAKLTAEDTQRLAALVRELVVQSLVPWMEARIREWNEVWQTNRRGITGRLFGAGRKLFGSSRPSSPAPNAQGTGYNTVKGYYPIASVEAVTRRLADFAFMLRDYRFASTIYDSLRRDTAQDRAWRYSAAATEMYGLSQLLAHSYFHPSTPPTQPNSPFTTLQHTDISSWLEQAVLAYQSRAPANQLQLDALRITILYYEAWKTIGEWRGVGQALFKAAGEADEVPSAVIIEEAAAADVRGGKSERGKRRRAFHLVLAANRYETAGLKTYSRRCLDRASQIYRFAPWTAAQDRIEYSLGRQAYTIGESDVAVEHFLRLLKREDTGVMGSQAGVLEDMALAYEQLVAHPGLLASSKERLVLPTPIFDAKATKIVASSSHAESSGSGRWKNLEQTALNTWDRKGKRPASLIPDTKAIQVSVDETFHVEFLATNPLNAPLVLSELTLSSSSPESATVSTVPEIELEPYESRIVRVPVTATATTSITFTAVSFLFNRFFPCTQNLERRGRRLHGTKAHRLTPTYAKDTSLNADVGRSRPRLEVELEGTSESVFVGEEVEATLVLRNTGKVAVEGIQAVLSEHGILRLQAGEPSRQNRITADGPLDLHSDPIQPGTSASVPITLCPTRPGPLELDGLVVFANAEDENDISHACLGVNIDVSALLDISTSVRYARSGLSDYLVGVEISNASSSAVTIDGIRPVSRSWSSDAAAVPRITLPPSQTYRHMLQTRQKPSKEDIWQHDSVQSLSKLVQGQEVSSGSMPGSDIADDLDRHLRASYLTSRNSHRLRQLQQAFPAISPETLTRIFPLLVPLDLDLAVSWSTRSGRKGTTWIHGIRPAPDFSLVEGLRREVDEAVARGDKTTRTMYEETGRLRRVLMESVLEGSLAQEENPVEVRVTAKSERGKVEHDFAKGPLSLPVVFDLRNRSPALHARWILRLTSDTRRHSSLPHGQYIGTLEHRGTIGPATGEEVRSSIWVHEPGMISLAGWEIEVETGLSEGEEWTPRQSWKVEGGQGWIEVVQA